MTSEGVFFTDLFGVKGRDVDCCFIFVHQVELLMTGQNLTMIIDNGQPRTIRNEGEKEHMVSQQSLYVGGLPQDVKDSALRKWHIRKATSVIGCLKRMLINNRVVDFSTRTGVKQYKVSTVVNVF